MAWAAPGTARADDLGRVLHRALPLVVRLVEKPANPDEALSRLRLHVSSAEPRWIRRSGLRMRNPAYVGIGKGVLVLRVGEGAAIEVPESPLHEVGEESATRPAVRKEVVARYEGAGQLERGTQKPVVGVARGPWAAVRAWLARSHSDAVPDGKGLAMTDVVTAIVWEADALGFEDETSLAAHAIVHFAVRARSPWVLDGRLAFQSWRHPSDATGSSTVVTTTATFRAEGPDVDISGVGGSAQESEGADIRVCALTGTTASAKARKKTAKNTRCECVETQETCGASSRGRPRQFFTCRCAKPPPCHTTVCADSHISGAGKAVLKCRRSSCECQRTSSVCGEAFLGREEFTYDCYCP